MAKTKFIIDTDAGIDDAIALMTALASQDADILAITTVAGNVDVDSVVRNVNLTLDLFGKNVPVFRGAAYPLLREPVNASGLMEEDGLGGASEKYPAPNRKIPEEPAAAALVRLVKEEKGPGLLTLVALGPLTNLALAVRLNPEIVSEIDTLFVMGGAMEGRGNTTPSTEFNFYADPEAAAIIFNAGFQDLQDVPWETSVRDMISWKEYDQLVDLATPGSDFFAQITGKLKMHMEKIGLPGIPLPDPITIAVALDSRVALKSEHVTIAVETIGLYGRGLMAVDWYRTMGKAENARIISEVDHSLFLDTLQNSLKAL